MANNNFCDYLSEEMMKDCDPVYLEGAGEEVRWK